MAENKTKPTERSVKAFIEAIEDPGKHKHGKGCLYIKRLEDIDMEVLKSLILTSIERARKNL